jgi:hypothetical protein
VELEAEILKKQFQINGPAGENVLYVGASDYPGSKNSFPIKNISKDASIVHVTSRGERVGSFVVRFLKGYR